MIHASDCVRELDWYSEALQELQSDVLTCIKALHSHSGVAITKKRITLLLSDSGRYEHAHIEARTALDVSVAV